MTIGIYKITNLTNGHSYIGQSRNIEKRWINHKSAALNCADSCYNYPLQRAFRKYGFNNFTFEIIEQCEINMLNEREKYWIKYYAPVYNQTIGGDYNIVPQKLTMAQVLEIQKILIEDSQGNVSHTELAKAYGVHRDTIRDINVGRTWRNDNYSYPLHYSKFDANNPIKIKEYFCIECGEKISKDADRCVKCASKMRRQVNRPSREELKDLIYTQSFLSIGRMYGVSDNTIRKWCKAEGLPSKSSDIKKISKTEWQNI